MLAFQKPSVPGVGSLSPNGAGDSRGETHVSDGSETI
jgi:hypothetical protein